MSKFNDLYNLLMEEIEQQNEKLTAKTDDKDFYLNQDECNPQHIYKWSKGLANVYGCKVTEDNLEAAKKFLKVKENPNLTPTKGKFIVYNPHISENGGQIWMNKLEGYEKATEKNSAFDGKINIQEAGLKFDEYIYQPSEDKKEEGLDWWYGFQIPKGMKFNVEQNCGNNGADGSVAEGTQWLPIVKGKFDWARSIDSMKQSNFVRSDLTSEDKQKFKFDEKCKKSWQKQYKAFKNDGEDKQEEQKQEE